MYNTNPESREMVFRISSTGFDWYNIIFQFVADNLSKIDTVTIVRDEEGTGEVDKYYRTFDGNGVYKQMPIDDFLTENDKAAMESAGFVYKTSADRSSITKQIIDGLAEGKSITELGGLNINWQRLLNKIKILSYKESQLTV